ncbi:hypothetical protein BGX38DRAFT_1279171 [Terfezia claveryi]|nr:hypothetical protein BGX38DRAFT_1279171 [Terfezia claveryi]
MSSGTLSSQYMLERRQSTDGEDRCIVNGVEGLTKTIANESPGARLDDPEKRFSNVALRRAGTAFEAAGSILALVSPLLEPDYTTRLRSSITLEITGGTGGRI